MSALFGDAGKFSPKAMPILAGALIHLDFRDLGEKNTSHSRFFLITMDGFVRLFSNQGSKIAKSLILALESDTQGRRSLISVMWIVLPGP